MQDPVAQPDIRPFWSELVAGIIVISAWAACAYASILLTINGGGIAAIWPANAVLLAALLGSRRRHWAGYAIGCVAAACLINLAVGRGFGISLGFGLANALEVVVAALLLRPARVETMFDSGFGVAGFVLCCVIATGVSASFSAGVMALFNGSSYAAAWLDWFTADCLGLLIITPLLLVGKRVFTESDETAGSQPSTVEVVAIVVMVTVVAVVVFAQTRYPLLFLTMVPVMIATHRLRALGAVLSTVILAAIGSWFTMHDRGPVSLIHGDAFDRLYYFQFYIAVVVLANLPKAAVLTERDLRASLSHATIKAAAAASAHQASTDDLTGLANRRALIRRLDETRMMAEQHGLPFALALFDIDHFKRINDDHGHAAGDDVLRRLAGEASQLVRQGDLVARFGGEEFAVLMPGADAKAAMHLGERMRATIAALHPTLPDGTVIEVTVSVGVAQFQPGMSVDALIGRADAALYEAKRGGRNSLRPAA
jgi:diguanylate cyclase (GGDEF)-like protein